MPGKQANKPTNKPARRHVDGARVSEGLTGWLSKNFMAVSFSFKKSGSLGAEVGGVPLEWTHHATDCARWMLLIIDELRRYSRALTGSAQTARSSCMRWARRAGSFSSRFFLLRTDSSCT